MWFHEISSICIILYSSHGIQNHQKFKINHFTPFYFVFKSRLLSRAGVSLLISRNHGKPRSPALLSEMLSRMQSTGKRTQSHANTDANKNANNTPVITRIRSTIVLAICLKKNSRPTSLIKNLKLVLTLYGEVENNVPPI